MSAIKPFGGRKLFYSLPENCNRVSKNKFSGVSKKREDLTKLVKHIDDSLIGRNATFTGPYGRRKAVYCDYATSGRSLQFIEDYILKEVIPNCGNADSTANITSLQSVLFRHEAIEIFRICTNATVDDTVIFTGLGCGGPINKLLQELRISWQDPPVVFLGPCERPSVVLLWKDLGAKVIRISESKEGFLDLNDLENQLMVYRNAGRQLIGCFSASNNVTGILADDVATTLLLHQHGALAFWDYTSAAPYVQLDMNPTLPGVEESAVQKDAMFFSGHKFLGGIQTPGILIAKKFLFLRSDSNIVSSSVLEENERQMVVMDFQEDCSVATIVEDVRAGLVMHLKEAVGTPAIMYRQEKITRTVLAHVKNIPEFLLLGNSSHCLKRLPFFSFIVRHPRGMFLHHNFVCSVLSDVFGIQVRGSCADAGSHALDFMGIDINLAEEYDRVLLSCGDESRTELEILRPGFCRISLPFCISDAELGFILEALKMVATEGWKLLPQYTLKSSTGEWKHHSNSIFKDRKWLGSLKYVEGKLVIPERKISTQGTCPVDYEECLHIARCIFNKARKIAQRYPLTAQRFSFDQHVEPLRWFMLPSEAHNLLIGNSQVVRHQIPFNPTRYKGCKGDPLKVDGILDVRLTEESTKESQSKSNFPVRSESSFDKRNLNLGYPDSPSNIHQSVPNFNYNVSSERQNSFSSEISNSDCVESPTYRGSQCYSNVVHHSSAMYPLDVFCYSPQPSTLSPIVNQVDANSPVPASSQPNTYLAQKNYCNQFSSYDLTANSYFGGQTCNGVRRTNFGMTDRSQCIGKSDPQLPVNKVQFLLGKNENCTRQRCNSLGSSLIVHPRSRGNLGCGCRSLTDGETSLNLSECSLSSNEDIHAYVTEVTKELATEIKSEIREVISKVEDVLSDSIDVEGTTYNGVEHRGSKCFESKCEKLERTNSLPSASANDIAQYLMGVSKEMAEEMKSEIRGLVNSVVSTESSPVLDKKEKKVTIDPQSRDRKEKDRKSEVSVVGNESRTQSRDSGINLSYTENLADSKAKEKEVSAAKNAGGNCRDRVLSPRLRSESLEFLEENETTTRHRCESLDSLHENDDSDAAAKNQMTRRKISRVVKKGEKSISKNCLSEESSNDEGGHAEESTKPRWCCAPKAVWKPAIEALKEFEMIENGDKVLVSLTGGKASLAILHVLQQYRCYSSSKGIHFDLGAVTFDSNCSNLRSKALLIYLEGLGIPCFSEKLTEPKGDSTQVESICSVFCKIKRDRICTVAKNRNYNVVAFSQNLDDLAENFLFSIFHGGRLRSMKAHCYVPEKDIRMIRPFIYVRERALRQFAESRKLPEVPENCVSCRTMSKEKQNSKQLLSHQESMFPRLFSNLKSAMYPLISCRYSDEEERLNTCVVDSDETSVT
ncbi:hypothetical protein RUM43_006706 [Polyplax serrata]|uniref:Uncharacterized protein n=1 Tax=Polyplax serrata TaxID=468196 RepID=A0AAN8S440_POLSC